MFAPNQQCISAILEEVTRCRSEAQATAAVLYFKMMKPTEAITLKAFVAAYAQLKGNPLPGAEQTELQSKLKDICQDLPGNIGKLHTLAKEYPALNERYKDNRKLLQSGANQRTKGPFPQTDYEAESQNQEIPNLVLIIEEREEEKLLKEVPDMLAEDPEAAYNRLMEIIISMGGVIG